MNSLNRELDQTQQRMIHRPGDETIYGYQIRYLAMFATYCRVAGVEPANMRDFVNDMSAVYKVLERVMRENLARCLKESLDRNQSLVTGLKEEEKNAEPNEGRYQPAAGREPRPADRAKGEPQGELSGRPESES